jgi:hypothetical protein
MIKATINDICLLIKNDSQNVQSFKNIVNLIISFKKKIESQDAELQSKNKIINMLKCQNDDMVGKQIELEDTNSKQLEIIDKLRIKQYEVVQRLQLQRCTRLSDKDQYDWFMVEYNSAQRNLEECLKRLDDMKKKYQDTKYKLIVAHWGAERIKLSLKVEELEHNIKKLADKCEEELVKVDSADFFKRFFEKQTPQVQKTMVSLGWLDTSISSEYRVGILYDTARAHNLREMMAIADKLVEKNVKLVRQYKVVMRPIIPLRATIMRESLRQDAYAQPMPDKEMDYKPEVKTMLMSMDIQKEEVDMEIKFPPLPRFKILDDILSEEPYDEDKYKFTNRELAGIFYCNRLKFEDSD